MVLSENTCDFELGFVSVNRHMKWIGENDNRENPMNSAAIGFYNCSCGLCDETSNLLLSIFGFARRRKKKEILLQETSEMKVSANKMVTNFRKWTKSDLMKGDKYHRKLFEIEICEYFQGHTEK